MIKRKMKVIVYQDPPPIPSLVIASNRCPRCGGRLADVPVMDDMGYSSGEWAKKCFACSWYGFWHRKVEDRWDKQVRLLGRISAKRAEKVLSNNGYGV